MGMAQPAASPLAALVEGYRPPARDEMMDEGGCVRAPWRGFMKALAGWSEEERQARFRASAQYLREAGVTYRVYAPEGEGEARAWPLSHPPLILAGSEWETLQAGLRQRALYLERLLGDLYGERAVIREGLLPGLLLGRNPEFLRPVAGQGLSGLPLIRFIAVDLGRGADGRWWVLADRTQAPSGAGFALENRVAATKAYPQELRALNVRRLAPFFDRFRRSLLRLDRGRGSRIGLLTPGQRNETFFEHAYLARYLGFQLLEGDDLVVTGSGEVAVRTVEGLMPVDVLWRRLDADFADPLELYGASAIGTPGLARAMRDGPLSLVNALGSGLLETRAFLPYERALARRLIGEDLALPSIATWWCGTSEADGALARRSDLKRHSAFPGAAPGVFEDDPAGFVMQEKALLSTAPAFVDGRLEPHAVSLRVFLALTEEGWEVMPGGFARLSPHAGDNSVSMQQGGHSADVWVVSDAPEPPVTLLAADRGYRRGRPGTLPARAADNLYWLGRQSERIEMLVRLARLAAGRMAAGEPQTPLDRRIAALLDTYLGPAPDRRPGLLVLARAALDIAARIRDRFSSDGWRALADLVALLETPTAGEEPLYGRLLTQLAGFTGLVRENMYQFTGWRFLETGRLLERGLLTAHIGGVLLEAGDSEGGAAEALLELTDSRMTYRRRFSVDLHREAVLDLCLLDPLNPRSLAFQALGLEDVHARLPGIERGESLDAAGRRLARLCVRLRTAGPAEVDAAFLKRVVGDLAAISDRLSERYFTPTVPGVGEGEGE